MAFLIQRITYGFIFVIAMFIKLWFWGGFIVSQLRPLSKIPGPWWARYTRFWLVRALASGRSPQIFIDVNKEYGPIARIGPNSLLTDDPGVTRKILAPRSSYTRAPSFDALRINPTVPDIVSERDPKRHHRLRSMLSAGYAGRDIDSIEGTIDRHVLLWLDKIKENWISDPGELKVFDIGKRIHYLTVDIITELCLGEPLGYVKNDGDTYGLMSMIKKGNMVCQQFSVIHELNTLFFVLARIPFIRTLLLPSATDRNGLGKVMGIIRKAVDQHFESPSPPKRDLLSSFLKHGLPRHEVETELVISLVAGSDTTATAVQSTLLAIISNPPVYGKLRAEIDTAVAQGLVTLPIQNNEAARLPYLSACVLEGLRKHPPVAQLRERMAPPEGDWIHGFRIPGGTCIGFNTWGLQLSEVFGRDPEIFRPERWLIDDEERLKSMRRTLDLVFGHGSTKCLGVPIAMTELNKIFFELLSHFDITTINPQTPWKSTCYGIFYLEDFNVRVASRTLPVNLPGGIVDATGELCI